MLQSHNRSAISTSGKIHLIMLHVKLSKPGTTLPFLKQVDVYVARVLGGKEDLVRSYRMLEEFVFLKTLREQFKEFLQSFNLPSAVCDDDSRWNRFLESYAG